jgi:hypothetical protein
MNQHDKSTSFKHNLNENLTTLLNLLGPLNSCLIQEASAQKVTYPLIHTGTPSGFYLVWMRSHISI